MTRCIDCQALLPNRRSERCRSCRRQHAIESSRERRATGRRGGRLWGGFKPELRCCEECGTEYEAHAPQSRFCSTPCGQRWRDRHRPRVTRARRYGPEHRALRKRWKVAVDRGLVDCARCGERIEPGDRWDLDHADDGTGYLGPSHARCNRATIRRRRQ